MHRFDTDGNVVAELTTTEPLTLYAHQLSELPEQVRAIAAQAQQQATEASPPPDAEVRP